MFENAINEIVIVDGFQKIIYFVITFISSFVVKLEDFHSYNLSLIARFSHHKFVPLSQTA